MKHTALFLALLASGCTSIDMHKPAPPDCPIKQVNTYTVPHEVMSAVCQPYAPFGMVSLACTLLYPSQGKAEIWITPDAPQWVIDHERLHAFECRDHVGSTLVEDLLRDLKQGKSPTSNVPPLPRMDEYRNRPFNVEFLHDYTKPIL